MEEVRKLIPTIHLFGKIMAYGLAITTAYMAYSLAMSAFSGSQYIPDNLESICVVIATMVLTMTIDVDLHKHGVVSISGILNIRNQSAMAWVPIIFIFILFSIRLGFSGGSTLLSGKLMAVETTAPPDSGSTIKISREKNAAIAEVRKGAIASATRLLESEERRAAAVLEAGLNSGNAKQRQLYERRDSWMLSKSAGPENIAYVRRVRKAEKESNAILQKATAEYKAAIAAANEQIAAIQSDKTYEAATAAITAANARTELITRIKTSWVRWIDFFLIFGAILSWTVEAYYLRGEKTDITHLFPDEPGIGQVIADGVMSAYLLSVAGVASVVAELKGIGAKKMASVAKSITTSSAQWQSATAAYSVAMSPSAKPTQHLQQPPQHPRNTEPQQRNTPATVSATPTFPGGGAGHGGTVPGRPRYEQQRPEIPGIPPNHQRYTPTPPIPAGGVEPVPQHSRNTEPQQRNTPATVSATSQQRNIATVQQEKPQQDSGNIYRAHLSKAMQYISEGNIPAAKRRLNNAMEAAVNDTQRAGVDKLLQKLNQPTKTKDNE